MKPVVLGPNQPPRFFRGGTAIARLRGLPVAGDRVPEDWVASTTTIFGQPEAGLSRVPDGSWLRDAVAADPEAYLGPAHAACHGGDPALLVKLLDAAERLPVHCHPDRAFARRHLDCPYGKTEAWVVAGTEGPTPVVHLGFRREVERSVLDEWVRTQDTPALLAATNTVPVAAGDTVLVPAGVPHAIGAGVFVVELQEPTDFSVLLEWEGFDVDGKTSGHLGLGLEVALACVDRSGWDGCRLDELRRNRPAADRRPGVEPLFPAAADRYFRAERIRPRPHAALDAGFAVLVVLGGAGRLDTERGGGRPITRGDTLLVPYAAGAATLSGDVQAIRCRPAEPDAEALP